MSDLETHATTTTTAAPRDFAARLREAVDSERGITGGPRHKRERAGQPALTSVANPSRVRDDELFAERLRNALD